MNQQSLVLGARLSLVVLSVMTACAPAAETDPPTTDDEIRGGTPTIEHPEVGLLTLLPQGNICTATLLAPRVVVTAAHCISPSRWTQPSFPLEGQMAGWFRVTFADGTFNAFRPVAYHSFARAVGADDISVVQLADDVPLSVTPAQIATTEVSPGTAVTVFGYGGSRTYDSVSGGGYKRKADFLVASDGSFRSAVLAPGDSGGPVFATAAGTEILRMNDAVGVAPPHADAYSQPRRRATDIEAVVRSFQPDSVCTNVTSVSGCIGYCAWYACANSCLRRGTANVTGCR